MEDYVKYLNISDFEENWGLYVTSLGYSKVEPSQDYPNKDHPKTHSLTWNRGRILDEYHVVYIPRGKGQFGSNLKSFVQVNEGTCFFLYPGVWHRYKPDIKSGWEEYWVGFNGRYAHELMNSGIFCQEKLLLEIGFSADLGRLFSSLIDTVKQGYMGYPQQLAGLTIQLLGIINNNLRDLKNNDSNPKRKLIDKAKFMIEQSTDENLDMELVARQLPMTYSSFRKIFKRLTGISPNQYHIDIRIGRARQLLETTLYTISEIGFKTGFETVSYFSKVFKQKTGLSPKEYRDKHELGILV